jgi:hypothetical protein
MPALLAPPEVVVREDFYEHGSSLGRAFATFLS